MLSPKPMLALLAHDSLGDWLGITIYVPDQDAALAYFTHIAIVTLQPHNTISTPRQPGANAETFSILRMV